MIKYIALGALLITNISPATARILKDNHKQETVNSSNVTMPVKLQAQNGINILSTVKEIVHNPNRTEILKLRTNIMTQIMLPEGEVGKSVALGDNQNIITEINTDPAYITLFPKLEGIDTNLLITTDRGVYSFYIKSYGTDSNITPDFLVRIINKDAPEQAKKLALFKKANPAIREIKSFSKLNDRYKAKIHGSKKRGMAIMPSHVYDDGFRTYIHYKKDMIAKRMPAVFAVVNGIDSQINYKVTENHVIVVEGLSAEGLTLKSGKAAVCIRPTKALHKVYKDLT